MSTSKAVPDELKSLECERHLGQSKLPTPYKSKWDVIQEMLAVEVTTMAMKLTLHGNVESRVSAWAHGTPEMHLQVQLILSGKNALCICII